MGNNVRELGGAAVDHLATPDVRTEDRRSMSSIILLILGIDVQTRCQWPSQDHAELPGKLSAS